jgi:protein SCO1/2
MTGSQPSSSGVLGRAAFVVAVVAAAAGVWFGMDYFAPSVPPAPEAIELKAGTMLPRPKPLQPFDLSGVDGKPFTLESLRGHWTFLAIGYTSCPDICPTTLATFRALSEQVNPKGGQRRAEFLFVSVDPERDTPERLAKYVHYFDPGILGATGSDDSLQGLTKQLGLPYARVEQPGSAMGYLMDHSAAIVLIDPEARLIAIFSAPHDPKKMAADFAAIQTSNPPRS